MPKKNIHKENDNYSNDDSIDKEWNPYDEEITPYFDSSTARIFCLDLFDTSTQYGSG